MHRHAVRGFVLISALAALMILAAGCSSSSNTSTPKTSPTATSSPTATTSMSPVAAACHKIQATLAQAPATLGTLAQNPSSARSKVSAFITKLKTEAGTSGSTALTSAVDQFTSSVQTALGSLQSHPGTLTSLISHLTKDSQKIATACSQAAG